MAEKEYIEREAAKKKHCEICMEECICYRNKLTCDGLKAFDLIPAADVRPVVRGKWIWKKSGEVVCSKCNDLMAIVGNTEDLIAVKSYHNFCPNCGADMREVE